MSKLGDLPSIEAYVSQVAQRRGWVVNTDKDLTQPILEGLSSRSLETGKPFCPCRDLEGAEDANAVIICPCRYSAADIAGYGQCYCGLFLAAGKYPAKVSSIPERRQL